MLRLFGQKILENIFSIFRYLVQPKMKVNKNHFQYFQVFNFWKTIYGFKNHKLFSKFKLFILARTFVRIRRRQKLEFVGGPNLRQRFPNFGIRAPESGHTDRRTIVAGIRQLLLDSGHCRRNPASRC